MSKSSVAFVPVSYDAVPGWKEDDHLAAFQAFLVSSARLEKLAAEGSGYLGQQPSGALLSVARRARVERDRVRSAADARQFFESHFKPHVVRHDGPKSLFTGYYEPVLPGSRQRGAEYAWPLLRRPEDLVNIVPESARGQAAVQLTHGRLSGQDVVPYATREEIESGALDGQGLEFMWLKDPVDVFFLHVQGSGVIAFEDGRQTRVTYDGKNGHPYTSVGRYLIEEGLFPEAEMSLEALKVWLKARPEDARHAMWQNKSYIFFRELRADEPASALGVMEIPLTAGRSMAVDTSYHEIGMPIYVSVPGLHTFDGGAGLRRLMIAQDVGSAIRGPERADLFYGTGDEAGLKAGETIHPGQFHVLKPRPVEAEA